jgi:dTDP-4-amino-4,6-dideoxygalactose transaminase
MDPILALARARGLPVVEDCAQAHGATYKGKKVGTLGDVAAFSTMSGKHHATGAQGGVVFTEREDLYWAARRVADRGKPFGLSGPQVQASSAASGVANTEASLNLNSSDLACAIGRVQLKKLPEIVAARQRVAARIGSGLAVRSRAVRPGWLPDGAEGSYWFLRLSVDTSQLSVGATDVARALAKEGIPVAARYDGAMQGSAVWLNERRVFGTSGYPWNAPEYAARGGDPSRTFACPNATAVLESDFNLRIHERWGDEEIEDTLRAIEKVEKAYLR